MPIIVASKLKSSYTHTEFDIIIPRMLGAPGNQEIAIGAIMEQEDDNGDKATTYLNGELIKELEISRAYRKRKDKTD